MLRRWLQRKPPAAAEYGFNSKVLPASPSSSATDRGDTNTIALGHRSVGFVGGANITDLLLRELPSAREHLTPRLTTLSYFVSRIFPWSAGKQMFWVDTIAHVAAMANRNVGWRQIPIMSLKSDAMHSAQCPVFDDMSIPCGVYNAAPKPTTIRHFLGESVQADIHCSSVLGCAGMSRSAPSRMIWKLLCHSQKL